MKHILYGCIDELRFDFFEYYMDPFHIGPIALSKFSNIARDFRFTFFYFYYFDFDFEETFKEYE